MNTAILLIFSFPQSFPLLHLSSHTGYHPLASLRAAPPPPCFLLSSLVEHRTILVNPGICNPFSGVPSSEFPISSSSLSDLASLHTTSPLSISDCSSSESDKSHTASLPIMMRNIMQGLEIGGRGKWKAGGRRSEIGVGESGGRESGGRESEGRDRKSVV